jgi:hypothetical protein
MTDLKLLSPATLGALELPNRLIMAPLTRCRAGAGYIPQPINATYYAQRASAGLIISEATQVARNGIGYPNTPGIHTSEQVAGWKQVRLSTLKADGSFCNYGTLDGLPIPHYCQQGKFRSLPVRSQQTVWQIRQVDNNPTLRPEH